MELRYLRDTDKREVDFIVLKNRKPLFAVECKSGEAAIGPALRYFAERTPIRRGDGRALRPALRRAPAALSAAGSAFARSELTHTSGPSPDPVWAEAPKYGKEEPPIVAVTGRNYAARSNALIGRSIMKRLMAKTLLGLGLAVGTAALAQPVTYSFSTGVSSVSMLPSLAGTSVVGSFVYDPSTPVTFTTLATQNPANASIYGGFLGSGGLPYSSYTNVTATVSGGLLESTSFTFSDPRGQTTVSNDGLVSPPGSPPSDILSLDMEPFGPAGLHNLANPFSIDGFRLWNMRLFWLESTLGGDFLNNQSLPSALPKGYARLALDFLPISVATGTPSTFVFYDSVQVTPVSAIPEPETYALLLAGLALVGFATRRKRMTAA